MRKLVACFVSAEGPVGASNIRIRLTLSQLLHQVGLAADVGQAEIPPR